MNYDTVSFEKRIKENIKSYTVKSLFTIDYLMEFFSTIAEEFGVEILLTDRYGEKVLEIGDFSGFSPDVINAPGIDLQICGYTVGYWYVRYNKVAGEKLANAEKLLDAAFSLLTRLGTETYMGREAVSYMERMDKKSEKERYQGGCNMKEDVLTGVCSKAYIESRMNVLDRSEVVPVAVALININDWKFVYDKFGVEKSDSLIQLVASIVMNEARAEYIIGRIEGDVFLVLIPMAEENEAEEYCRRVQEACLAYEGDTVLAPSVAVGFVIKTNVEEHIQDLISDAEYEMLQDKMEIKSAVGYRERLERGL